MVNNEKELKEELKTILNSLPRKWKKEIHRTAKLNDVDLNVK